MHIIIIKCFSIMNIIIMYQNIMTVHFQVYMNNFPFTKEEIILNKSIYFKCNCFFRNKLVTFGMRCVCV